MGLECVIRQAFADAAGRDYLTQTEEAVRAVLQVRPEMTVSDGMITPHDAGVVSE